MGKERAAPLLAPCSLAVFTLLSALGCGPPNPVGSGGAGGTGNDPNGPLPCNIDNILRTKCQACHGGSPKFGAPMPLTSIEDIRRLSTTDSSLTVWQKMQQRVHDAAAPMPPKGQTPLSTTELAALDAWFAGGASGGNAACTNLEPPGDLTALAGPAYLPCTPNVYMRAHARGSTDEYTVPTTFKNTYSCFTFKNPFPPGEQGLAWAPAVDNDQVVHHAMLYGMQTGTDGAVSVDSNCYIATATGKNLAAWAPGSTNYVMDPDVSLSLDFPYVTLQIHHSNNTGSDAIDQTGFGFCTGAPRENTAGILVLGSTSISVPPFGQAQAVGQCDNLSADGVTPITIVSALPHMHVIGSGFRTEHVGHADLSNIPVGTWDFDTQKTYQISPRRRVLPGEILRTTCTYSNPTSAVVRFGAATTDEMCYNFVTAYPYAAAKQKCGPPI
jgi:hypothetical protein